MRAADRLNALRGRFILLAVVATGALGLSAGTAAALTPPQWGIKMTHVNAYGAQAGLCASKVAEPLAEPPCGVNPFTEKEAGDKGETFARESASNVYEIKVANEGEEEKKAGLPAVEVVDHFPKGIVLAASEAALEFSATGWKCSPLPGAVGAKCSREDALAAKASYPAIKLYVAVRPEAESPSINRPSVSGGGAAEVTLPANAESEATITPAVPFGIHSFNVSILKEALPSEVLLSQAAGHPFATTTEIVLNYNTTAPTLGSQANLGTAGNGAKELQAEIPPGFTGDPQNAPQCPLEEFIKFGTGGKGCPENTAVGYTNTLVGGGKIVNGKVTSKELFAIAKTATTNALVYNLEPPAGRPAAFGFYVAGSGGKGGVPFVLEAKLRSDTDYGVTVGDSAVGEKPLATKVTICDNGVQETAGPLFHCLTEAEAETKQNADPKKEGTSKPFLRNFTECTSSGPAWTVNTNPWGEPLNYQTKTTHTNEVNGCEGLQFKPSIEFEPSAPSEGGTKQADSPTGMTLNLKLPQTNEDSAPGTPDLKDVTMTLPEGMTVSPSAGHGLQACTNAQFGLGTEFGPGSAHSEPALPATCPLASQIGTVEVVTPLLKRHLEGQLFIAEPECGSTNYPEPCNNEYAEGKGGPSHDGDLYRLFLQAQDPIDGVIVKLHGFNRVNPATGQITSVFEQQPEQPFEVLTLKLKGGPTAPLATPQTCGSAITKADITPWSTPFTADATPESAFNVEGCAASMPFSPGFNAGTTAAPATAAGQYSPFELTLGRNDGEQDVSVIQVHMPLGLVGKIAGVPRCGEAQANAGTCGPESEIGTAEAGAGPGKDPFYDAGRVYLTGPTTLKNGLHGPFGLSVVTPAVAGPFNLGNVVVRSVINIDPRTAAVTVTSDPLPQFVDGVELRLRTINVKVNRSGFMLNPTSCSAQSVSATVTGAQGASAQVASPFGIGGCTGLAFHPTFTAVTDGHTSKEAGASLNVKITYPPGGYANIAKSLTELPIALPSRLTTIQKACVDTVFEANPAACDEGSVIGQAIAYTPLLEKPLTGPAYLVSHGNRAFPDIEIVLQGEGITVDLDGLTDIKKGITKTDFESLPDSPISSFELNLPEGPHSALAAPANLCEKTPLLLPTVLTGQNGAVLNQDTNITVTGCSPTVALTKAKLSGNALVVTVKTTGTGTVKISGKGLKTTKKTLGAGTHEIRVLLTKLGRSMRNHHKKVLLRVNLTVGKQVVAKSTSVRL